MLSKLDPSQIQTTDVLLPTEAAQQLEIPPNILGEFRFQYQAIGLIRGKVSWVKQPQEDGGERTCPHLPQDRARSLFNSHPTGETNPRDYLITVNDVSYPLLMNGGRLHQKSIALINEGISKEEADFNLKVYPRVNHRDGKPQYSFQLIRVCGDAPSALGLPAENTPRMYDPKESGSTFVLQGTWQYVPYCESPVILVRRNKNNHTKKIVNIKPKPNAIPVSWDEPLCSAFRYDSSKQKDQQMPRYFVQVRAKFINATRGFEVVELLGEPSLKKPISYK